MKKELDILHNQLILVFVDKAENNSVYKAQNIQFICNLEDSRINSTSSNPTYAHILLSKEEVLQNQLLIN